MIRFSTHAVGRFAERLRPVVGEELHTLADAGEVVDRPPDWVAARSDLKTDAYLVCGDVVFPLRDARDGYLAVTCIVRGTIPEATREARNRSRAGRTASRRARKLTERSLGKPPRGS